MTCIINNFLEVNKNKLRNKSPQVVARYIKAKMKIDLSINALQQKMDLCIK